MEIERRDFLKKAGTILAGTVAVTAPFSAFAATKTGVGAADKLNIALIGCKGMGWSNLKSFLKNPEVNLAGICDIDENILSQRKKELQDLQIQPQVYTDYRKLLENKDVDAVIIATPDHWHCLQMIEACAAGKDVYVEKPLANSIEESRLMTRAVEKYGRIVQVNQWQRSQDHFNEAVNYIHQGSLGKIVLAKTWMHRGNTQPLPKAAVEPVPEGVHYDMWLGPAPKRPFDRNHFHYDFRWYWDYAGGLMTDWGVHLLDIALWGMKCQRPEAIMSSGGKYTFPDDARETPDTQSVIYRYPGFDITWEHTMSGGRGYFGQNHGIAFIGQKGTLVVSRKGWEVFPEREQIAKVEWKNSSDNGLDKHVVNFINAVRTRDRAALNCPVPTAALCAEVSHMGNIALRAGGSLDWDESKQRFGNKKANRLIAASYNNGWRLPRL